MQNSEGKQVMGYIKRKIQKERGILQLKTRGKAEGHLREEGWVRN